MSNLPEQNHARKNRRIIGNLSGMSERNELEIGGLRNWYNWDLWYDAGNGGVQTEEYGQDGQDGQEI